MIKLIIFDIDGTIVNAYGAIYKSIKYALRKSGYRRMPTYLKAKRSIGYGDRNFVATFVKPEDIDKATALYRKHHERSLLTGARVMPCAKGVLSKLHKKGYKLAVCSNRPRKFSMILLKRLALTKYFDMIECADNKKELKPSPFLINKIMRRMKVKKPEALYVGDMDLDIKAGRNAGVRTVAVLGGSSSRADLESQRPFKMIRNLCGLLKI